MKGQLADLILATLHRFPGLNYFQGYHDIAQVLLLVLGPASAASALHHVSLLRIRDFMLPSLSPSLQHLQLLPAIIRLEDPGLGDHLTQLKPFFAMSAALTLYAHDIEEFSDIARLFDFLLAHEASISMYLFAVIIISRREELFEIEADDADMLHFTLSKLPKPLDLETLIRRTLHIFREHPPTTLPYGVWRRVSTHSVLKTSHVPGSQNGVPALRRLSEGEAHLEKQTVELHRIESYKKAKVVLWKYRRPIGGLGVAIFIGLLSIWLQSQDSN